MAIFERGYRPYEGSMRATPAWWTIMREGWATALRSRALKWIGILQLLVFAITFVTLLIPIGLRQQVGGLFSSGSSTSFFELSQRALTGALRGYFEGTTFLTCLLAMFIGSGLIANDRRSNALSLYLARPLHRWDYLLGKFGVLPVLLAVFALLPGLVFWLIVGLWQDPGETVAFWKATTSTPKLVWNYYLIVAGSMTGLMLLATALASRAGIALSGALGVLIGGQVLAQVGSEVGGVVGKYMGALGIVRNAMRAPRAASVEAGRLRRFLPDEDAIVVFTVALLILGAAAAIWRTRSTEVS